jgi:Uma2 family endonuclease
MATNALITSEQYLSTHFEREPELVHGEIAERPLPTFLHGNLQLRLGARLLALQPSYAVFTGVEVRVRIGLDLIRIPDISMWAGPEPPPALPTTPPLLTVEISSPDDRLYDLLQRFEEYRVWGVQHIWLIQPELKRCHIYDQGSLTEVSRFMLPQFDLEIPAADLFA